MSDAAIVSIVSGVMTFLGMLFTWLTLNSKLKYASANAEKAVIAATEVERKLDGNTTTTNAVNSKADTIVKQTNGTSEQVRLILDNIAERVGKLEEYNHESAHRLMNAINPLALKVERLLAMYEIKPPSLPATTPLRQP